MGGSTTLPQKPTNLVVFPGSAERPRKWYALHVRVRHEKKIAQELQRAGVETFIPLVTETHRWSDRRQKVELPLFPCYLFIRISPEPRFRAIALLTRGVLAFVGANGGVPIPAGEIDAVRAVVQSKVPFSLCKVSKGQRVRVRGGVLDGVEGMLISDPQERRLVIAVGEIHQSLSVSVEGCDLEAA